MSSYYAPISTLEDESASSSHSNHMVMMMNDAEADATLRVSLNNHRNAASITPNLSHFSTSFTHIPAACQFRWTDSYYQGKHGIVAVCDRNGALAGNYQFWVFLRLSSVLVGLAFMYYSLGNYVAKDDEELAMLDDVQAIYFLLISIFLIAMAYRADLQQRQQHVAVTTEGIRMDQGTAMTIIIPFETIHSCTAELSTKYLCGWRTVHNLSRVRIVRTLAPLEQVCFRKTRHLELYGLEQPQELVELIQAMQHSQQHGTYQGAGDESPTTTTNTVNAMEMVSAPSNIASPPPEAMQQQQQLQELPMVATV